MTQLRAHNSFNVLTTPYENYIPHINTTGSKHTTFHLKQNYSLPFFLQQINQLPGQTNNMKASIFKVGRIQNKTKRCFKKTCHGSQGQGHMLVKFDIIEKFFTTKVCTPDTLYRSKVLARLTLTDRHTDKLTDIDMKQYTPEHSFQGHEKKDQNKPSVVL